MAQGIARKIKVSLNYYRSFAPFNILLTGVCAYLLWSLRVDDVMAFLFFLKIAALAASIYLTSILRPHEIYYYRNLEIPRRLLWGVAVAADLFLFFLATTLTKAFFL